MPKIGIYHIVVSISATYCLDDRNAVTASGSNTLDHKSDVYFVNEGSHSHSSLSQQFDQFDGSVLPSVHRFMFRWVLAITTTVILIMRIL